MKTHCSDLDIDVLYALYEDEEVHVPEPTNYLRIIPDGLLRDVFGMQTPQPVFGRLGTIFCNDEPAIRVLEIVRGEP